MANWRPIALLAVTAALAVGAAVWAGTRPATPATFGAQGQTGRFQIVPAKALSVSLKDNTADETAHVFLLDTQTGHVWLWTSVLPREGGVDEGWRLTMVDPPLYGGPLEAKP